VRAVTHQIAGVGLAGVSVAAADARGASAVVLIAGAWVGSLVPDADLAGARAYRRTRFERRVPLLWPVGPLLRLPIRLLTLLPHRGFTHSVLACALAALLSALAASLIDPDLALAATVGVAIGYGTSSPTPAHLRAYLCGRRSRAGAAGCCRHAPASGPAAHASTSVWSCSGCCCSSRPCRSSDRRRLAERQAPRAPARSRRRNCWRRGKLAAIE